MTSRLIKPRERCWLLEFLFCREVGVAFGSIACVPRVNQWQKLQLNTTDRLSCYTFGLLRTKKCDRKRSGKSHVSMRCTHRRPRGDKDMENK